MPLDFEYCFGFKQVQNSVAFYDENTAVLTAGNLCILHDLDTGRQRRFELAEMENISAIVRNDNYILAAVKGRPASICVFQMVSGTKKCYIGPNDMKSQEFISLSLAQSRTLVAAQSGGPDWMLVVWQCNTRDPFVILKPCEGANGCSVIDISFSPCGQDELVVVGKEVFKLYEYQTDSEEFVRHAFGNYEDRCTYYSIAWPQNEHLAVGSSSGHVLFFRGIEIIYEMNVFDDLGHLNCLETIDLYKIKSSKDVLSVCVATELLVCLLSGVVVLVYQGEQVNSYKLFKHILMPSFNPTGAVIQSTKDYLKATILSPDGKSIVGATHEGRLLYCNQITDGTEPQVFLCIMDQQHNEPIIGIDTAISKPLIASCSQHIMILWNYKSKNQEIRKQIEDKIVSIALHPSGLYLALSFERFFSTFSILHNDLKGRQRVFLQNCSCVKFSKAGHLLAVARGSVIEIYSFHSHEHIFHFNGHAGPVSCMDWKVCDSLLVSCDDRGVTCEWGLISGEQNWEHTAVVSYVCVATDSGGNIIAVGLNRKVSCLKDGLIAWSIETKKELTSIVFHGETGLFYTGTMDGCLVSYSFPSPEEKKVACVHSGKVTAISMDFSQDLLVSVSDDGFIFLTKINDKGGESSSYIFETVSLVDCSQLQYQQDRSKHIQLSLEYSNNVDACESEVSNLKHEKVIREITLENERVIRNVNEKIFSFKEEIQGCHFLENPLTKMTQLDKDLQREVMDTSNKISEVFKKNDSLAMDTKNLLRIYTATVEKLSNDHKKFSSQRQKMQQKAAEDIRALEIELHSKKKRVFNKGKELSMEDTIGDTQNEITVKGEILTRTFRESMDAERKRSADLTAEIKRLTYMVSFRNEDTRKRRNLCTGEVIHDIKEKKNAITYLKGDFRKLESSLRAKEKLVQNQEQKFCSVRTLVSALRKKFGVSRTELEEVTRNIRSTESKIESCQRRVKLIEDSIPELEKELEVVQGLCETVTEKAGETTEGVQTKRKLLRETQEVLARYTEMLHRCLSREYDLNKLVQEITKLFEDSRIDFSDGVGDPRLQKEYDYQIEKLKKAYELVKNEPSKCTRDKAMAEFRLSQENSMILRQVHETQKEDERLRSTLTAMEGALLLQIASRTKGAKTADEDVRAKIDFVTHFGKKTKFCNLEKLDKFIEEQQKEIARFQTMLSAKERKK